MPLRRPHSAPKHQALTACLIALMTSTAASGEIILITTSQTPLAVTKNIRTINLNLPAILEADLSSALPANPAEAQAIATQRITPGMAAQLTYAYQNVTEAWSMGVTKVPAVMVDRKYVVYGETNVQRALDRINEYRRKDP